MWVLYWLKKQHYFFFFIMSNHEHQEVKDTFLFFVFFYMILIWVGLKVTCFIPLATKSAKGIKFCFKKLCVVKSLSSSKSVKTLVC